MHPFLFTERMFVLCKPMTPAVSYLLHEFLRRLCHHDQYLSEKLCCMQSNSPTHVFCPLVDYPCTVGNSGLLNAIFKMADVYIFGREIFGNFEKVTVRITFILLLYYCT